MTEGERAPIRLKDFKPRQEGETDAEWSARCWQAVVDNIRFVARCVKRFAPRAPRDVTDDYVQAAAIHAHRILGLPSFDPSKSSVANWLCLGLWPAIAYGCRAEVEGIRRKSKVGDDGKSRVVGWHRPPWQFPPPADESADPFETEIPSRPGAAVELERIAVAIREVLEAGTLSEREQVVLAGRMVEGRELKEIGAEIGCSGERVRQIELRAMARLRAAIKTTPAGRRLEELFDQLEEARG